MPRLDRVLETVLYVDDFERACPFYEQVLGLVCIHTDGRLHAYDVGGQGVLLLFRRGQSLHTVKLSGGSHPRPTTAMARTTWPSRSRPKSWRPGRSGWQPPASRSRVAPNGRAAATASISAIRTGHLLELVHARLWVGYERFPIRLTIS